MDMLIFRYVEELKKAEKSLNELGDDTSLDEADELIFTIMALKEKIKFLEQSKDNKQLLRD